MEPQDLGVIQGKERFATAHLSKPPPPRKDPSNNGWPRLWRPIGNVPSLPYNLLTWSVDSVGYADWSSFQAPVKLDEGETIENFRAHVNERDFFWTRFPKIVTKWSGKGAKGDYPDIRYTEFDYKSEPHFAMLFGMYVASMVSGISVECLDDKRAPNVTKSIAKFHLYFQTRKFVMYPNELNAYTEYLPQVVNKVPHRFKAYGHNRLAAYQFSDRDYMSMIGYRSNGITTIGRALLTESIYAYVFCVLSAQFKYKIRIAPETAVSDAPHRAFLSYFENTLKGYNDVTLPNDMSTALNDAHAIVNLAITPDTPLIPSNLELSKKLPGYANTVRNVTGDMKFGLNSSLNYDRNAVTALDAPDTSINTTKGQAKAHASAKAKAMEPATEPKSNIDIHLDETAKVKHHPSKVDPNLIPASTKSISRFGEYSTVILLASVALAVFGANRLL